MCLLSENLTSSIRPRPRGWVVAWQGWARLSPRKWTFGSLVCGFARRPRPKAWFAVRDIRVRADAETVSQICEHVQIQQELLFDRESS